jgi:hypothetical protein
MKSLEELNNETVPAWMVDEAQAIYDEIHSFDETTGQDILQKALVRIQLLELAYKTLGFQNQIGFILHGVLT